MPTFARDFMSFRLADRTCNPIGPLHAHFPKFVSKRLDVGLTNLMQTQFFNQRDDVVKFGSHIRWQGIKFAPNNLIPHLYPPHSGKNGHHPRRLQGRAYAVMA